MPSEQPVWQRMYFNPAYVELTRLVRYDVVPIGDIRKKLDDLAEKFGRKMIDTAASELMVIDGDKQTIRLRDETRKLAFGMLGPPPEYKATSIREIMGEPPKAEPEVKPKKQRKRA